MDTDSPNDRPAVKSAAREFFLILLCAVALSFAFVHWMKSSVPGANAGLGSGESFPPINANAWINGPAPAPGQLQGKVYVVIAWATWCLPCRQEAPHLVETYEKYHPLGVEFYGLAAQPVEQQDEIAMWLAKAKIPWPNGYGPAANETLLALNVKAIPAMWVVGKDGTILWNASMMREEPLGKAIERALAQ